MSAGAARERLAPAGGVARWAASYRSMLRYDIAAQRTWLPLFLLLQVLFGAGMSVIYGFYIGHAEPGAARFIVTGAPALPVVTTGLVLVPSVVAEGKVAKTWDYLWSLPVPRSAAVASSFTVYTALALPGIVVTTALASWRYSVPLTITPMVLPAFVLGALMAASVGYGMGQAIRDPMLTNLIGNVLIFVVLLFSPVVFPISQLPGWLAAIHRVLPIYPLAQVIRASLSPGAVSDTATCYAVLGAWTLAGWLVTGWVVKRRG